MTILYTITSILLIVVYLFSGMSFWASDLSGSLTGVMQTVYRTLTTLGILTTPIGIIGVGFGFYFRKKENMRASVLSTFAGFLMILAVSLLILLLNSFGGNAMNASLEAALREGYGEDWNAPSNYEELPETYQLILDKEYVAAREQWDRDALIEREHLSWKIPAYYGENGLENIGFCLLDLNGDGLEELVIGEVVPEGTANTVFSVWSDPEKPDQVYKTYDTMLFYLHEQADGTYLIECDVEFDTGEQATYMLQLTYGLEGSKTDDVEVDVPADAATRSHIELIPLAKYR